MFSNIYLFYILKEVLLYIHIIIFKIVSRPSEYIDMRYQLEVYFDKTELNLLHMILINRQE